jgi:hypothetical protein
VEGEILRLLWLDSLANWTLALLLGPLLVTDLLLLQREQQQQQQQQHNETDVLPWCQC